MINKLKYFFLLVICVGLIGGLTNLSAQTSGDRILVSGKKTLKQSEIDKLIEFYEWAFEATFTYEQREKFQQYTEIEFRNDPTTSRKTIDDIVLTLPKILAAESFVQTETRKNFLDVFLTEARKNSDENSELLLGIYEKAHGENLSENNSTNSTNSAETTRTGNSAVANIGNIANLVGEWVWGSSGSMTTNASGVYLGGNASRHTYQFDSNGTVKYTGIMNIMTGGCRMQIFKTSRGTVSLNGDMLTIQWSPASFSRDDSCSPSKNYKKTLPAETETFKVGFKDSYGQKQLCLTGKGETCYSRK